MRFTKMQGAGNDYVYVDTFEKTVADASELARRVSDRHFGIGSDGLILIEPPCEARADCRMTMYNADGSRAQMCGNGIRCVAKYAHDHGIARRPEIRVETDAGLKTLRVHAGPDGLAREIEVDMGTPRLRRSEIPLVDGEDSSRPAVDLPLSVAETTYRLTAVSMGNPHAVIRLSPEWHDGPLADIPLQEIGPRFEHHEWFPERVNTEFIRVCSARELELRVWERGSGETLACGTGACAALVAGVVNGWCETEAVVHLPGGDLRVRWRGAEAGADGVPEGGTVILTGPAVEVFTGEWPD